MDEIIERINLQTRKSIIEELSKLPDSGLSALEVKRIFGELNDLWMSAWKMPSGVSQELSNQYEKVKSDVFYFIIKNSDPPLDFNNDIDEESDIENGEEDDDTLHRYRVYFTDWNGVKKIYDTCAYSVEDAEYNWWSSGVQYGAHVDKIVML